DEKGMRKDTLILFSSDNGGPQPGRVTDNRPLRAGKGTPFEGGVPGAAGARRGGHLPPRRTARPPPPARGVHPAPLELGGAGATQPLPLDGRDAWATIAEGKPSPHDAILLNATPRNGAVRVGDWKLVLNGHRGAEGGADGAERVELFNLADDLGEKTNLAE